MVTNMEERKFGLEQKVEVGHEKLKLILKDIEQQIQAVKDVVQEWITKIMCQ